ncbi:hypothetical protein EDD15DRAFT_2359445 [Pisolithus albus]|nr:hypothetical protein EDD15DRAFT_2359445 [Pisolithus albus]
MYILRLLMPGGGGRTSEAVGIPPTRFGISSLPNAQGGSLSRSSFLPATLNESPPSPSPIPPFSLTAAAASNTPSTSAQRGDLSHLTYFPVALNVPLPLVLLPSSSTTATPSDTSRCVLAFIRVLDGPRADRNGDYSLTHAHSVFPLPHCILSLPTLLPLIWAISIALACAQTITNVSFSSQRQSSCFSFSISHLVAANASTVALHHSRYSRFRGFGLKTSPMSQSSHSTNHHCGFASL